MQFNQSIRRVRLYLLTVLAVSIQSVLAQAPQGLNYQAIARNNGGIILPNQNVGLRFTITNGNGGSVLYEETQAAVTNQFGLFTVNIGSGTPVSGTFSSISWSAVTPWLKVDMDATGGNNYIFMGTSQLLSVPYALYAASAGGSSTINGTVNYLVKFIGSTTGGNSLIYDNGTFVGIGTTTPSHFLDVVGSSVTVVGASSNTNATGTGFAAANTAVGGPNTGNGLYGSTSQSNGVGVYGANFNSGGTGVLGIGNNVPSFTLPIGGSGGAFYGNGIGLYGFTSANNGYGVYGKAPADSSYGVVGGANGVAGAGPEPGAGGVFFAYDYGVFGYQTDGNPDVQTAAGYFAGAYNAGLGGNPTTLVEAWSNTNTHYKIWGSPAGTVSTTVPDLNGNEVTLHAPETPEFYFQDYGQDHLVNGKAHINLDPIFAKNVAINEKHPLRAFVQLEGECKGVYVTNKTATGFDVIELEGGTSNVSFQWNVTCNVADMPVGKRISRFADLRFEPGPINQLKNLSSKEEGKGTK